MIHAFINKRFIEASEALLRAGHFSQSREIWPRSLPGGAPVPARGAEDQTGELAQHMHVGGAECRGKRTAGRAGRMLRQTSSQRKPQLPRGWRDSRLLRLVSFLKRATKWPFTSSLGSREDGAGLLRSQHS